MALRLSLIMATYNRAAEMVRALESVAVQSAAAEEWECVVVDNNSTDDTLERFAQFTENHKNINLRMVHERQQGLSHARNRGIAESSGDIIAIIDDDERICPDFIRAYIEAFDGHPEAASAGGRTVAEYPSGRPGWMSRWTEQPIANPLDMGDKIRRFGRGRIPCGGNMAVRRSVIERYGAFDTSLGRSGESLVGGEESDLFARLARGGEKCIYVPQAVMYHIIPPSKLTEAYFDRLAYNIGVTQRRRAGQEGRMFAAGVAEYGKWAATLAIAAWYAVSGRTEAARWLIRLRSGITRGFYSEIQVSEQ